MENASRALLIAAGMIIGVLIITVAITLFSIFGNTSKEMANKLEESKIIEFNNNFYKYYGEGITITVHDIITITNFARKNNKEMGLEDITSYSNSSEYIQIDVKNDKNLETNFEKKTEDYYKTFIKNNLFKKDNLGNETESIKYYKCTNIITNANTGKVIYIRVEEK